MVGANLGGRVLECPLRNEEGKWKAGLRERSVRMIETIRGALIFKEWLKTILSSEPERGLAAETLYGYESPCFLRG